MKKVLLGLFLGFVGLLSFGYSAFTGTEYRRVTVSNQPSDQYYHIYTGDCIFYSNNNSNLSFYDLDYNFQYSFPTIGVSNYLYCVDFEGYVKTSRTITFYLYTRINLQYSSSCPSCPSCPTCPDVPECPETMHCPLDANILGNTFSLDGYDYISVIGDGVSLASYSTGESTGFKYYNIHVKSDLTGGMCTGNINTGDINWSALFINGIEHQSAPLINVIIPEEYSWDSSVNDSQFDLVISGQNVDYEYIDNIITTQKTLPNNQDFNNIVSGLIPLFIPGLCIILLIYFIYLFIKKVF